MVCAWETVVQDRVKDMRLLFIAPRYHTNQHFIMKSLVDNGHVVKFLAVYRGMSEDYTILRPTIVCFTSLFMQIAKIFNKNSDPLFKAKYGFPNITKLFKIVHSFNPDVVIIRSPKSLLSWISIFLCKLTGKKIIMYSQGPKYRSKISKLIIFVRWFLLDLLNCVWITPVEGEKTKSPQITHRSLYYLPFIYEVEDYNLKRSYFEKGRVRLLCVGKYVYRKNHILLLEAIHPLINTMPLEITLVGECSTDEHRRELLKIHELIGSKGLSDIVTVKCNLTFCGVQSEYPKHDIFVLPSSNEPAAYSVLEAMAHGLAVVCSDSNGTKEYIKYGHTGYVFKSDCVTDLRNKLYILLSDRAHVVDCGRNGFEVVKREHSPEKYHSALLSMIKDGFSHPGPLPRD